MWKILLGFAIFAAAAMYILTKSGADVDMGGEKHEVVPHGAEAPASAAQALPAPASAAPAASAASS